MPYPIKAKKGEFQIYRNPAQPILGKDTEEIDEAVNRVYRQYGTDLPAFFRDVRNKIILKREELERTLGSDKYKP